MIAIQQITVVDVLHFKAIRLRALQDAPGAFGATYAAESQLTDADWLRRTERWNGEKGAGFLAFDESVACGIVGIFLDENDKALAHVVSMWTSPTHRRRGVGRRLIETVIRWARNRNVTSLLLMVTSLNDSAIRFYERLGFSFTGRTESYPNDPAVMEREMELKVVGRQSKLS